MKLKRGNRKERIKNTQIKLSHRGLVVLSLMFVMSNAEAEETIIQQEKISFEKCLQVITTSENKLSVAPQIEEVSGKKRVAKFTLLDGTLTIVCDGELGNVKVSTNSN